MGEFDGSALRFGFSGQRRVIDFETATFDDSNIGWDTIAEFHLDYVSDDDIFGS